MERLSVKNIFKFLKSKNKSSVAFLKIAIFGLYKSGTTACFLKIKDSLPCPPRELFEEPEYIYQPEDRSMPVLAKVIIPPNPLVYANINSDHSVEFYIEKAELGLKTFEHFDKKILLIRDPRDWLVSGTLFLPQEYKEIYKDELATRKILELLHQKELSPKSVSLIEILDLILSFTHQNAKDTLSKLIRKHHNYIINFEKNLTDYIRWKYEDMIDENKTDVETYLGFTLTKTVKFDQRFKHVPRTISYGNWRDWFTQEDVDFFKPLMSHFIDNYGYNQLWELNINPKINPEHASKYVERTINYKKNLVIASHKANSE